MKRWHSLDFTISILVNCDDEVSDPVEKALEKITKLKLPKNININSDCTNVTSEGDGLEMIDE